MAPVVEAQAVTKAKEAQVVSVTAEAVRAVKAKVAQVAAQVAVNQAVADRVATA